MAQQAKRSADRRVRNALCRRSAAVCRRELDAALDALDREGELTPEQRAVVRAFAKRVSHGVVAGPLAAVESSERTVCPETAAALFEP